MVDRCLTSPTLAIPREFWIGAYWVYLPTFEFTPPGNLTWEINDWGWLWETCGIWEVRLTVIVCLLFNLKMV